MRHSHEDHPQLSYGDCGGCKKKVLWANRPNGRLVPLDPARPVFFVILRKDMSGVPRQHGMTWKEFCGQVSALRLRDGREVLVERILAVAPSHFETCRQAAGLSRKGKMKNCSMSNIVSDGFVG
jgi:hypothetical protein